jgi:hypothetical protein
MCHVIANRGSRAACQVTSADSPGFRDHDLHGQVPWRGGSACPPVAGTRGAGALLPSAGASRRTGWPTRR